MKKSTVLFMILLLLFSCGKKSASKEELKNKRIAENKEAERYNGHVNVYNQLLTIERYVGYYFTAAGTKARMNRIENDVLLPNVDQKLIDDIKGSPGSNTDMKELDEKAQALVPVLEEMKTLTDEMRSYYKEKEYLKDGYKKGVEMHKKFIETVRKYSGPSKSYKSSFRRKSAEKEKQNLEKIAEEGKVVRYNLMLLMSSGNSFLDEIQNEKLNSENFTDGDIEKFKMLQKEIHIALENLKKSSEDKKNLDKEGFDNSDFTSFMLYMGRFSNSIEAFVSRMEKKEKIRASMLKDKKSAENIAGTPENIFSEYNSLVKEYNKLLNGE